LSVGFQPVEDKWDKDRTKVVRIRAQLGEVSAYRDAKVASVRADDAPATPRLTVARLTLLR